MEYSRQTQALKPDPRFIEAGERSELSREQGSRPWLEDSERNRRGGLKMDFR